MPHRKDGHVKDMLIYFKWKEKLGGGGRMANNIVFTHTQNLSINVDCLKVPVLTPVSVTSRFSEKCKTGPLYTKEIELNNMVYPTT